MMDPRYVFVVIGDGINVAFGVITASRLVMQELYSCWAVAVVCSVQFEICPLSFTSHRNAKEVVENPLYCNALSS